MKVIAKIDFFKGLYIGNYFDTCGRRVRVFVCGQIQRSYKGNNLKHPSSYR